MRRVLFVDLNNSARFPALAIGYLVARLRAAGLEVEVFSPLSVGVPGFSRDTPDTLKDHLRRRVYFSTHPATAPIHDAARRLYKAHTGKPHPHLLRGLGAAIARSRPAVILISAYLDHRPSVEVVAKLAADEQIPVVLGGPVFNHQSIAEAWAGIPGVTYIYGGEADDHIVAVCGDVIDGRTPTAPGVLTAGRGFMAPALHQLSGLPLPDLSDFPWKLYDSRVLTVMTGRGCSWGRCTFCSDIVTANGRGFRTRPLDDVLEELTQLSEAYRTRNTFFLDIKLNSDLEVWDGLIARYQETLPGGKWIGTVHVAARGDNGLDRDRLAAARESGMARVSFGLESGSDALNRRMGKGTSMTRNLEFMQDAKSVGLSVRASMMLGYPGETAADVAATAEFLEAHGRLLDRVRISRFKAIPGTRFERLYARSPGRFPGIEGLRWAYGEGRADYRYLPAQARDYRRAKARVLREIYEINRRPLPSDAEAFNGLM